MEFERLKAFDQILVIGYAATGKTSIGNEIALQLGYSIIHTDDYIGAKFHLVEKLLGKKSVVVEGTMGYDLLNLGYMPGCIVICNAGPGIRSRRGKNYDAQDKGLNTQWVKYFIRHGNDCPVFSCQLESAIKLRE